MGERLTLCMIVHAYYPLAEPRVQREARAARQAGFEVSVLALRGTGEPRYEVIDGVRVHRVPLKHKRGAGLAWMALEYVLFSTIAAAWLAIKSLIRPFAIVHVHAPPDFLLFAASPARLRGSRLILDVHDLSSHMLAVRSRAASPIMSRMMVWIERLAAGQADAVITVHEPYRATLASHGVPREKVHVVMNGVDEGLLDRACSRSETVGHPRFTVVYHGTLTWWYGVDLLVDAVVQLREQRLRIDALILGDGDAVSALEAAVARVGLAEHVKLSGRYVPIEDALARVAVASCGVIPNRPSEINRFALSSKLFEYVALAVPVVVAELDTLAAHFGPEEVTFFRPGDSDSLADAIRWVFEHPEEARAKAGRARERAVDYSWRRGREVLLGLYEHLTDIPVLSSQ